MIALSIVVSTANDDYLLRLNSVDQSISVIYSARPKPTKVFAQRFGFADAIKRVAQCRLNELIDTAQRLFILRLPPHVVLPRGVRECDLLEHLGHIAGSLLRRNQLARFGLAFAILRDRFL